MPFTIFFLTENRNFIIIPYGIKLDSSSVWQFYTGIESRLSLWELSLFLEIHCALSGRSYFPKVFRTKRKARHQPVIWLSIYTDYHLITFHFICWHRKYMSGIVQYRFPRNITASHDQFCPFDFVLVLQNWIQFYLTTNLALQLTCV